MRFNAKNRITEGNLYQTEIIDFSKKEKRIHALSRETVDKHGKGSFKKY